MLISMSDTSLRRLYEVHARFLFTNINSKDSISSVSTLTNDADQTQLFASENEFEATLIASNKLLVKVTRTHFKRF